jgi:hypothetical protein
MVRGIRFVLFVACAAKPACASSPEPAEPHPKTGPSAELRREYEPGHTYRYVIERRYFENGELKYEQTARSAHRVLAGDPPRERIRLEKLVHVQGGKTEDRSSEVESFPPYEVSLAPGAAEDSLALPDLSGWDMQDVGVVTDLHTFSVAVSPQAGVDRLSRVGQSRTVAEPQKSSWANGEGIAVGQDCIRISATLRKLHPDTAVVETDFTPPRQACLEMIRPWMDEPVDSPRPNNFQQKMKMGGSYGVMWGRERFTVRSTVRRTDGMLLEAEMNNGLKLRMRIGCNEGLTSCQHEVPLRLRREVTLERVTGD